VKQTTDPSVRARLTEAAKLVNQATRDLQQAAVTASDFKQEKQEVKGEKFKLQNSKIQEMEQQIEILRMERELEKKKQALLQARKKEYETKEDAPIETTGKVAWRKSRAFDGAPKLN
jgi:talin